MERLLAQNLTLPGQGGGQTISGKVSGLLVGPNGEITIGSIISGAIPFILGFAGLALLLMLLMGGFTLLTSTGDAKKLEQGKQQLTFGLVGFLIVFTAYLLVQLTGKIFGLTSITDIFK